MNIKIIGLTLALSVLSIGCIAQGNWISISINEYQQYNIKEVGANDTEDVYSNKGLHIIPTVGYYKMFKNKWWLGFEIGYSRQRSKLLSTAGVSSNEIGFAEMSSEQKVYHICPVVGETVQLKQYKLMASLKFPLEFVTSKSLYYNRGQRDKSNNEIYWQQKSSSDLPDEFSFGIFANVGLLRQLYHGLYAGPNLGVGVNTTRIHGSTSQHTRTNDYSVIKEFHYQTELNETTSRLDIRPTLSVHYFF